MAVQGRHHHMHAAEGQERQDDGMRWDELQDAALRRDLLMRNVSNASGPVVDLRLRFRATSGRSLASHGRKEGSNEDDQTAGNLGCKLLGTSFRSLLAK